jgi:hypothetical protein
MSSLHLRVNPLKLLYFYDKPYHNFTIMITKRIFTIHNFNNEGELNVLAKHNRRCKLGNLSHPSNITSRSYTSGHATEKQVKQLNIHIQGKSST